MSLQNFLMAAKRGDLQKLQQELEADPSVINAQLTEGLLGGHTAIEFAAFELRIDAVNYLLNASWVSGQILAVDGGISTL